MGFGDVLLYFITAGVNLQWVAIASAAGPSSITVWFLAFLTMAIPLALSVVEMSSRYPQEGGMYVWSKRAFGDFAAFMTGWTYWMSNLPYFPGVLYFAALNALYIGGDGWRQPTAIDLEGGRHQSQFVAKTAAKLFVPTPAGETK